MRRGAPFSMVSTVRDDPRRSGYLRNALYAIRMTKKILALSWNRQLDLARSRCRIRACEIARDRVGSFRSNQCRIRAQSRVECVPEITRHIGFVTSRRTERERHPAAHRLLRGLNSASSVCGLRSRAMRFGDRSTQKIVGRASKAPRRAGGAIATLLRRC